eukprot:COSAG01_NODE_4739_length_4782_cov_2.805467_6_plen_38_part_00
MMRRARHAPSTWWLNPTAAGGLGRLGGVAILESVHID